MRNLKKVLALVLALAMSMSLVTIANAADFKDKKDISYTQAVEVMNAIGVLEGFEDGSFKPGETLTREQAAKIICTMLLGENADKLGTTSSSFKDVAATRWSAPYIEYCASLGIVAGNGDGTFNPTGKLNGYAFAKMLLTALGYNAETEGFVGAGWSLKVAAMASRTGILDSISDFAGTAALTREQAAQMALNTLTAVKVEYVGNTVNVSGPDIDVSVGNNRFSYVENLNSSTDGNMPAASGLGVQDRYMQFGEQHFPNLVVKGATDSFGRPASKWTLGGSSIGTYADTPAVTFTAKTKDVAVKNAISGYSFITTSGSETKSYTNGDPSGVNCTTVATLAGLTGNGKLVQVYTNKLGQITQVIVVNSVLGKVVSVDKSKEQVKITTFATNAGEYGSTSVTLTTGTGYGKVERNDIVVVTPYGSAALAASNSVASVEKAQTVTGISTSKNTANKTFTIDGTAYTQAANADTNNDIKGFAVSATKNATLYLDAYGYVLRAEGASAADAKSMIVQKYYAGLNDAGEIVYYVQGIDFNGTTVSKRIDKSLFDSHATMTKGTVVEYFDDGKHSDGSANDGTFGLAVVIATSAGKSDLGKTVKIASTNVATTAKSLTAGTTFYFADSVKFIFGTSTADASAYDGIREVKNSDIYFVLGAEDNSGNPLITAVFVNAAATASTTDPAQIIFVNNSVIGSTTVADTSVASGNSTHNIYKGFVTGNEVENVYAPSIAGSNFYVISKKDANGAYVLDATTKYTASTGAYAVDNGNVVSIGNDRYMTIGTTTYDIGNAMIVDTRNSPASSINSVAELAEAIKTHTIKVFVMFNADNNVAEYVYVDSNLGSNDTTLTSMKINTSAATLYTTAADANSGTKLSIAKDTVISISDVVKADSSSYAIAYDHSFSASFTKDGDLQSGTTQTNSNGANSTDMLEITVTAADGVTTAKYYTAITVTG